MLNRNHWPRERRVKLTFKAHLWPAPRSTVDRPALSPRQGRQGGCCPLIRFPRSSLGLAASVDPWDSPDFFLPRRSPRQTMKSERPIINSNHDCDVTADIGQWAREISSDIACLSRTETLIACRGTPTAAAQARL